MVSGAGVHTRARKDHQAGLTRTGVARLSPLSSSCCPLNGIVEKVRVAWTTPAPSVNSAEIRPIAPILLGRRVREDERDALQLHIFANE